MLLSGQPGTGKEPLARAIHKASARRDQPFTSLACTSVAGEEFTRTYLSQLLQITRGNVTQAAKLGGRNWTDFYKLLGRHDLQSDEFKGR